MGKRKILILIMLLQPKSTKFLHMHKGSIKKAIFKNFFLSLGNLGLKVAENGFITAKQLDSLKNSVSKKLQKSAKIWVKVFPNHPVTKKPKEARMGKGKGYFSHWAKKVCKGAILLEVFSLNEKTAANALKTSSSKLPLKTLVFK